MNRRTLALTGGLAGLAALAALAIAGTNDRLGVRSTEERPPLALITSLPLVFGESFALEGGGSAALTRLEQRYIVKAIAVADGASLNGQGLLLMAHPRAQPAEALVDLDQWVRNGGRLLLLADPNLNWPSERPFGDRLRPPPAFADTGLLAHWGLKLHGAEDGSDVTAGHLTTSSDACIIVGGGLVARCHIGRGWATIIADADFLNAENSEADSLTLLVAELGRLESR